MNEKSISRYPVPDLADLPDDIKEKILSAQARLGFIPNVLLAFAHRPDEFRAFFVYRDFLMEKDSGLSESEREMIVVAISSDNNCQYCVAAHGAVLRIRSDNALISDQIAVNYRRADISARQKAMLDFAIKVSHRSDEVDDDDFALLRDQGFSDEDMWDIASITALFGVSNRLANFAAIRPNDQFYAMRRDTT